jgi:dihydrolipoamide dehydrogenase
MDDRKQVIIIGAGTGGYAAAFQASELGLDVTLIDPEENPGGVCLYYGCIPTKTLLHLASVKDEAERAREWGIDFTGIKLDIEKIRSFKDSVVKKLTGGLGQLAKIRKVNYLRGKAKITGKNKVGFHPMEGEVTEIMFDYLIIATGTSSTGLPDIPFDGDLIMDAKTALELKDIPKRLLVVGAGYIGLEMSVLYKSFGSDVTIVEFTSDILQGVDEDLKDVFKKERRDLLSKAMFETEVTSVSRKGKALNVELQSRGGEKINGTFDRILLAIGASPNTKGIGLENAGVKTDDKGLIIVDAYRRTNIENIYAVGDITGQPMLAHKATAEGRVAAEHIAGQKTAFEPKAIPSVIFTDPEIAYAGLTETEAKNQNRKIKVARFPWSASGKAVSLGLKNGFTKLIIDPESERILGGGIVGKNAGVLVAEIALAVEMAAVARDLELTIHPHPTMSETIMEAAEVFYGHATHLYRKSKKSD